MTRHLRLVRRKWGTVATGAQEGTTPPGKARTAQILEMMAEVVQKEAWYQSERALLKA